MILPCKHEKRITDQVQPTIELLTDMDVLYPNILLQHAIQPADYKGALVFRSAIESIRGTFIASSPTGRQGLVKDVLDNLQRHKQIAGYQQTSSRSRCDFSIVVSRAPDYFAALEVKGGEGNSINISERPNWAKEFGVWCHLDGAIVNQPSHGAHSIINRVTNELVRRRKVVDVVFFKDVLCGTAARPCPKYPGRETSVGLETAPDVFLLPSSIPSTAQPKPPIHGLQSLRLPALILDLFGVSPAALAAHLWEVEVQIGQVGDGRIRRSVEVRHQGRVVDSSKSRPWRP